MAGKKAALTPICECLDPSTIVIVDIYGKRRILPKSVSYTFTSTRKAWGETIAAKSQTLSWTY
jgi:hypothetical protein